MSVVVSFYRVLPTSFTAAQELIETTLDEMRDYDEEGSVTWQECEHGEETPGTHLHR